jgi:hypothetical protein
VRLQTESTAPGPTRRERSLRDPVVERAIANVHANIAALPASDVVQLAIWPQTLAAWARASREDESQLSNLFRRYRIYGRLREALARRLDVPVAALAHLIEARAALPKPYRRDAVAADADATADALPSVAPAAVPGASQPYPPLRNGSNPIERAALARLAIDCPSMPASRIVGLALWPETLTGWATHAAHTSPAQLMTALSGLRRAPRAEIELARRLAVSARAMDDFIASVKAPSRLMRPPLTTPDDRSPVAADGPERPAAFPSSTRDPRQGELDL